MCHARLNSSRGAQDRLTLESESCVISSIQIPWSNTDRAFGDRACQETPIREGQPRSILFGLMTTPSGRCAHNIGEEALEANEMTLKMTEDTNDTSPRAYVPKALSNTLGKMKDDVVARRLS